ncbi:MAG: N-formylglutamate amidohydrolase [Planctomycetes bacterium]|nr:N-formylglutamate amidohydrolase [Planctomycetota bacterium]
MAAAQVQLESIAGVCEVMHVRGASCPVGAPPDVLFEVPHGATRAHHFDSLRAALRGAFADDLRDFFFVNTDVGAPDVALLTAERFVDDTPSRSAVVVRCLIPRTFIDCNRVIDPDSQPAASAAGAVTPGLQPYVRDPADIRLLLDRYRAYRDLVSAAFDHVCGSGGRALMVHSYAPRSIDVPVDDHIVASLRNAYRPETIGTWPLRAEIDLITHAPDGSRVASESMSASARAAFSSAGFRIVANEAYALHPVTLAWVFATRWPERTLCLEIRRDLLVPEFTPFSEMTVDPEKADRVARALARTLQL